MSFSSAIFLSDDFSLAAIGALMESRSLATNKLYYYTAQFAGDTEQTLREHIGGGTPHMDANNNQVNGMGAPLKIKVTRDLDGRVKGYDVVRADNSLLTPNPYSVEPNTGVISVITNAGPPVVKVPVGYVELKTIEGGALSAVQTELNNASAVISSFSNLIAANKQTVKSIFNVIR